MDELIPLVNYGLTLWFLNDVREQIVSLDTIWSLQGIFCIFLFIAGIVYIIACHIHYIDRSRE